MAGEEGRVPNAPPVSLDRVPETAAEARSMIYFVQQQLAHLGRWADLRIREGWASDPGIDVRRPPGPEPLMHSPVPTMPTAAPPVLNCVPATAGGTAGKASNQEGEQRMPDDAAVAGSEIKLDGGDAAKAEEVQYVRDTRIFFFGQCRFV